MAVYFLMEKKNGSKSPSHFQVFSEEVQPSLHTIFIAFHKIDTQSVPNSCWESYDSSFI